jgi:poly-gamma-glutamate capsule biosynthesis protein CapA/YwtB (metallophosphatase superfamily)
MHLSRFQRKLKKNKTETRKLRRWTLRVVSVIILTLCLYTAWEVFGRIPLDSNTEEEQPYTIIENNQEDSEFLSQVPSDERATDNRVDQGLELKVQEESETVRLAFVGDVMLGANVDKLLKQYGYGYPYVHISSILKEADIAAGNLENPITDRGEAAIDKSFVFRTSPDAVPEMVNSGFDVFNLANNHTLDYGLVGLQDTIRLLTEAGLHGVGAGMNEEEAYRPVIIEKNGMRVAYFGLTNVVPELSWKADEQKPGLAETYNYTRPVKAIEAAKGKADIIVVMVHWGLEGEVQPEIYQQELAHRYIDAGADLVMGSHPHVLQGLESYKGKWIAYSLGNFIFTTSGKSGTAETAIVQASCLKTGDCQLKIIPIITGPAQPKLMEDNAAKLLFQHLSKISFSVEVQEDGQVRKTS